MCALFKSVEQYSITLTVDILLIVVDIMFWVGYLLVGCGGVVAVGRVVVGQG